MIRKHDGFISATMLCKLGGRLWADYYRLDVTKKFLRKLSNHLQLPLVSLVDCKRGGAHHGTWVHPLVATNLALWINSDFAVHVSDWIERAKKQCDDIQAEYNYQISNIEPAHDQNQVEREVRDRLALKLNGTIEVEAEHGPIDLVTHDEVIEVKSAKNYLHALGQVLGHSEAFPSKGRRIHLFGSTSEVLGVLDKAAELCAKHDVIVSYEYIQELDDYEQNVSN